MPGDIPHPSEHTSWPSWFYAPDTDPDDPAAGGQIFTRPEEVPEGWAADWLAHGTNLNREPVVVEDVGLTRAQLKMELTRRDIAFQATSARAELQRLLDEALEAERLEDIV